MMAHFLRSGMAPTKNGQIDVDGLYTKAAQYLDLVPNAAAIAAQQKADAEAKARADAAAHRQAHTERGRAAGASIGTRAPTAPPGARPGQRRDGPPPSVRDRLIEALREHST
jgi:hypothetical protein